MTGYKTVELLGLIKERAKNNPRQSSFAGQKIEVSGRIRLPYETAVDGFLCGMIYGNQKYLGLDCIWARVPCGTFWKSAAEKMMEKAGNEKALVLAKGRYEYVPNIYGNYDKGYFLRINNLKIIEEKGDLSLAHNGLEGFLAPADEGKLSIK